MKLFILVAPAFLEWPIAIMRELRRQHGQISFCGLATGQARVFHRVQDEPDLEVAPFHRLDDLERRWLSQPADLEQLAGYEARLGRAALRRILVADRHLGQGYVSGGRVLRSRLSELAKDPEMIRRYLGGLLDHVSQTLEEQRPDLILCYAVAGAPAMALALVAEDLNIPLVRLTHTRIGARFVLDDSPLGLLAPVQRRFQEMLDAPVEVTASHEKARSYLDRFRAKAEQPDYVALHEQRVAKEHSLTTILGEARKALRAQLRPTRKSRPTDLRASTPWERLRYKAMTALQVRRLRRASPFRRLEDLSSEAFAYYPLHVDPEASTMVLAPMHTDQLAVIEALAKSLPLSMSLAVKEHLPMLGLRPPGFYERLAAMPGVVLLSPQEDSLTLIRRAAFTAAITGTAAWEAILLQRPALVFGEFPYSALGQGFLHCPDLSSLPAVIPRLLALPPAEDHVLTSYLAALFEMSFEFPSDLFWGQVSEQRVRENSAILAALTDRIHGAMAGRQTATIGHFAEA